MKQIAGVYLPDGEMHMPPYLEASGGVYQSRQLQRSLDFVTDWGLAVDIGAHVGLWSKALLERFSRVIAFEPMRELRECLERNVSSERLDVVPIALGAKPGSVSFDYDESHTGMTHVSAERSGLIPVGRLDDFRLTGVGYIKIDTEGFELQVLQGARATLLENKPIVIVEEKFHGVKHFQQEPYAAIEYLESLGAAVLDRVVDDFIMGWPDTPGKVNAASTPPLKEEFGAAMARHQKGDIRGARLAYRALIRNHPDAAEAHHMLAICAAQLGDAAEALSSVQRAIELDGNDGRFHNSLATFLWMAGRRDDAMRSLERALTLNPDLCEAHQNLGEMCQALGQLSEAVECYRRAVELKPNSTGLLCKLGKLHAAHGSTGEASRAFRQALSLNPELSEAREALAALPTQ